MSHPNSFVPKPFSPRDFMSALERTAKETDPAFFCMISPALDTVIGELYWTNSPAALYQIYFYNPDNTTAAFDALDKKELWTVQLSSLQNTGIPRRVLYHLFAMIIASCVAIYKSFIILSFRIPHRSHGGLRVQPMPAQ